MKYLINTTYLSDSQKRRENVELSSSCPCCGVSLFPDLLYAVCVDHDDTEEDIVYTFNHCQNCDECFISKHPFDEENGDGFIYASSSPVKSCEQNFSEAITSLSPDFVSIYTQAALAESLGLDQICGIGYRKAIEFLVKTIPFINLRIPRTLSSKQLLAHVSQITLKMIVLPLSPVLQPGSATMKPTMYDSIPTTRLRN